MRLAGSPPSGFCLLKQPIRWAARADWLLTLTSPGQMFSCPFSGAPEGYAPARRDLLPRLAGVRDKSW
jgi:hypothetical protein